MAVAANARPVEEGVHRDLRGRLDYGGYLQLDRLLDCQRPLSRPEHHDELLFIVQHQTSELWLKLVIHELRAARAQIQADALALALKMLARVKVVQRTLTEQWSVLTTLTPSEYAQFRGALGNASGLQSWQYRAVEFLLGNKSAEVLELFAHDQAATDLLGELLHEPSLYDEFLRYLHRHGHEVPDRVLERDWSQPYEFCPELVPTFTRIYDKVEGNWAVYEACEELVDVEDNFQLWRFRHMKTVERTIGYKRGTGGSSGVAFLRAALDLTFFPELYAVRTQIGRAR